MKNILETIFSLKLLFRFESRELKILNSKSFLNTFKNINYQHLFYDNSVMEEPLSLFFPMTQLIVSQSFFSTVSLSITSDLYIVF
jgi:hypothetical protein